MMRVFPTEIKNHGGFTLIELIVSLAIIALIGFGASSFLIYASKGFLLTRANIETFQKINLAMERLIRETKNMETIWAISSDSIRYQRDGQNFGIAQTGDTIRMTRSNSLPGAGSPGAILMDHVNSFSLGFEDINGNPWTVPADNRLTGLSKINIQITVNIENTTKTFTMQVNPFYNDMVNGPTS
ncbi:MAG: prepilin-type N-terminal cleavage/methylation domain-containing protein [Proteobacteria bacterium]|nr:prepilin-type N-terminal cleavage/methylation domain-containing protein [Pseudomonadota bacterium]MBU1386461.1 prepilin-type N-terminal cleavage/methylation domain-containing protein [Pseudomonadota bacterium]MBU1544572.1 prepilin-type N-terminal cleavage/methylation domain-containing protein [Pseudomonadota bacterium]MBU2431786.1 prepilin-type N-terminal cleavage/methylation domain-containing protein [Pseudomonadota bacterium]MBU2481217.1 prepilin-type N-terminal cleavage/methylation domain